MAMAAVSPSSATRIPTYHSPISSSFQRQNADIFMLRTPIRTHLTASFKRTRLVRASNPRDEDANAAAGSGDDDETKFLSQADVVVQEDLIYLVKLGGSSAASAAAIKYGSIIFPEITQPNIVQALIMISAPVLVSVFLLIKQSRVDSSNSN